MTQPCILLDAICDQEDRFATPPAQAHAPCRRKHKSHRRHTAKHHGLLIKQSKSSSPLGGGNLAIVPPQAIFPLACHMPRPTRAQSLQDLRHIRAELQARRAQAQARERARAEQQKQQQRQHFATAVGPVQPLRGDHATRVQLRSAPAAPRPKQRERDHAAVLQEALSDAIDISSLLETDEQLSYKRAEIGEDVVRKLRRGQWSIRAEIDLHGLRRDDARASLSAFIRDCRRRGLRCVRIVTGKGLGSPGRVPVLKHKVYGWLMQKQDVLAFVQARPEEGGAGALIVLLAGGSTLGN